MTGTTVKNGENKQWEPANEIERDLSLKAGDALGVWDNRLEQYLDLW